MNERPAEYLPDSTGGITPVEDLPKSLVCQRSRNHRRRPCPWCHRSCYRDGQGHRTLHDLGCLLRDRPRVRRYPSLGKILDRLNSPNLEKALTFLDDKLLPATSNAVERGNRRLGKMQKAIYRVRRRKTLQGRLALDLQREQQASDRQDTVATLHGSRP